MPVFKTGALNRSAISPISRRVPSRCPHAAISAHDLPPFHKVSDMSLAVFKTAALNHSATLPAQQDQILRRFADRTKQEEIRALQTDCKHHPSRSALLIASAALPSSLRKRWA